MSQLPTCDVVIVGAGVMGLAVGRALSLKGYRNIKIIEKEPKLGLHSSGRNSGVLHAGLYYPPDSLKARLCVEGAAALRTYLNEKSLPFEACGKLVMPPRPELDPQLDLLWERSQKNGVRVKMVGSEEIKEIEPLARRVDRALYSPDTWVFDPKAVIQSFKKDIESSGHRVDLKETFVSYKPQTKILKTNRGKYSCGFLINAAGLWADEVAHSQGVGMDYQILPFRGRYLKLAEDIAQHIRGLIYPVPDLELPFLGVHVTRGVYGTVTVGPTATPAFGRENYKPLEGLRLQDGFHISKLLSSFVFKDRHNMRKHMLEEIKMNFPPYFTKMVQQLVPSIEQKHLKSSTKMGLRAQVVKKSDLSLCMDFIVERGESSLHIINAVSPAFSSCMAFADWLIQTHMKKGEV